MPADTNAENQPKSGSLESVYLGAFSLDEFAQNTNWDNSPDFQPQAANPWACIESSTTGNSSENTTDRSVADASLTGATDFAAPEIGDTADSSIETREEITENISEEIPPPAHEDSMERDDGSDAETASIEEHSAEIEEEANSSSSDFDAVAETALDSGSTEQLGSEEDHVEAQQGEEDHVAEECLVEEESTLPEVSNADEQPAPTALPAEESRSHQPNEQEPQADEVPKPPSKTEANRDVVTSRVVTTDSNKPPANAAKSTASNLNPTQKQRNKMPATNDSEIKQMQQYLRDLETLVLELNMKLAQQQESNEQTNSKDWLNQRIIDLSLENLKLQTALQKSK